MTLAEKLNKIIIEQNISKREFAQRLGISENYLYILTGNSRSGTDKNLFGMVSIITCPKEVISF